MHHFDHGVNDMLFRKSRVNNTPVVDTMMHVYMLHFVEHDATCIVNAPSMHHAYMCARSLMHRYTDRPDIVQRPLMYDHDRVCIVLYSTDYEYTCNIMRMRAYNHDDPDDIEMN